MDTMIAVKSHIKGLIFDCDGTLVDTMPIHIDAWCRTFAAHGVDCPEKFIDAVKGMPAEKIVERFNHRYQRNLEPKSFAAMKNRLAQRKLASALPIEPVVAVARAHAGRLPMAVASGGTRANVHLVLESIGIRDWFETVITADDAVLPKPDPGIYIEAARRLGVPPRYCQVFEDGDAGLEAARRAGMTATDVRPYLF
jgi:HAD superfamily hydrolase (TIGR01509 family)